MTNFKTLFSELQTVNECLKLRDDLNNLGEIKRIKEELKIAEINQKKILGPQLKKLQEELKKASDERIFEIQSASEKDNFLEFDPTFYSVNNYLPGSLHPITQITEEILDIFKGLGFDISDGPLVSTQENTFTKLNMPSYHPARAMQDTFYLQQKDSIGENYVLRTHTTAHDVTYAKTHKPPFQVVFAGKVFRNETIDATHDIMFHQVECLVVDKQINLGHLKTLIQQFYSRFFGVSDLKVRLRPSYFPYTIPSMEVDISNPFKGKANSKLANQDWIEVGGSGLMHPQVIANFDLDPNKWQALAFGFGIDRMAQLKLGISGMGQFFNGHLDFLKGNKFV